MTPYGDLFYFGMLAYIAALTLLLGLCWRQPSWWVLGSTALAVWLQYGALSDDLSRVCQMVAWQALLAFGFLWLRQRTDHRFGIWSVVALCLLPMLAMKTAPQGTAHVLGISYITLRCIDVLIGIQDRLITSLSLSTYLSYVLFFPTIAAGPVDRYRRFHGDLQRRRTRSEFMGDLDAAIRHFYRGLLYKFILAAAIERYWLDDTASALSYMYPYTLHLFFDFAGYSALAIGVSYLLGIHTPQNFAQPFLAPNIREFWNRWHISLSWWLRDHVYMRFLKASLRRGWFRHKHTASAVGHMLTFGIMAAWHGLTMQFLWYGFYQASMMIGYDHLSRWNRKHRVWGEGRVFRFLGIVITFHVLCFSSLLFSGYAFRHQDRSGVAGRLQSASCDGIRGWAWDSLHPHHSVTVRIKSYKVLGTVQTDARTHRFFLPMPQWLKDGYQHGIRARVVETGQNLEGSPLEFSCGEVNLAGYEGKVDASCDQLIGQAEDRMRPQAVLTVDIYVDERKVASVPADQNQRHLFSCPMPASAHDGRQHSVRVFAEDVELCGSPLTISCP